MKSINITLKEKEIEILKSLIGTKLLDVYHGPFIYTNTSSQVVQICASEKNYYLYSFTEPMDHFGAEEDVAVWSFEDTKYNLVNEKSFINMPINNVIKKIILVNENQKLFENEQQIYDVWITRALIIDLGDYQISFEKAVWFSEDIIIRKGYELIKELSSVDNFINNNWSKNISAECVRHEIILE